MAAPFMRFTHAVNKSNIKSKFGLSSLTELNIGKRIGSKNLKSELDLDLSTLTRRTNIRSFSLTNHQQAKRIDISSTENKTLIEGIKLESEKAKNKRQIKALTGCPLCEFQDTLTYKDVLILHQFLSPDGRILPRHVTGMCSTMQWKLENILYQSYSAGLLPDYKPNLPTGENPNTYTKDYKWRRNNVYYDDFSLEDPL